MHPASCSAASWLASSCRAVEQRAYPTRIGLPAGTSAAPESMAGPGDHDLPGGGLAAAGAAGAPSGGVALGAGMALDGGRRLLVLVMEPLSAVPASGWWPDAGTRHVRPVTFRPGGGAGRRTGSRC